MELPSSSSSLNPQTLPSPPKWEHGVFLSFRGVDTRNNFTDHLYHALRERRIKTFRDKENLPRGRSISPELLKAIETSQFAVTVLSTNYATSTWCLDELAHIVKCKTLGMEVLPVFYHVDPSEIRWQTGNYGQAFAEHDTNIKDTRVRIWREALQDITSHGGWHVTRDRSEAEVVQEIVVHITKILYNIESDPDREFVPNRELVGMDARIKEIESYLELESNDVLTVGIWGMGGIGKTTLAYEVFEKIRNKFHHRRRFKSHVRLLSAVELLRCLCETFLGNGNSRIDTVDKGIELLKKALSEEKVLIVLDDVVSFDQIECLAPVPEGPLGKNIWGAGSRLIITTRDRSSLMRDPNLQENDLYEVDKLRIYEVGRLSDEDAFQLLCQKAFKEKIPPEEFEALSQSFLQYAGGLPLAHKVIGSYLSRCKVECWSEILHRLDDDWDEEFFSVLQVSFDELQDTEKKIFLDIACFFYGEDLVRVQNIFSGCDFSSSGDGISNLVNKSLIKIERGKLQMHDLQQCLCWHIVHGKTVHGQSSCPGTRSRLWVDDNAHKYGGRNSWRFEDAREVLIENTGTSNVEGLFLNLHEKEEMSLENDPFLKMSRLRLLKIYNVNFLGVHFGHVSRNLRLLEWHECPLQSLPSNFNSVKLVEIKMPNSCIEKLWNGGSWNGKMSLKLLTLMDLSDCRSLATTPDFSQVPNLERLILQGCKELPEVDPTIRNLQKLKVLNLKGCTSLEGFPQCISLSSLETFILSGCSKFQKFPHVVENMDTLSELYLDGTDIREVPVSIQYLKGLILLNLSDCKYLLSLPSILCSSLTSLKFLYLSLCSRMDKLPDNIGCLEHLEELDACNTAISKVPESTSHLKNLKLLCFHGCSGFTGLEFRNRFEGLNLTERAVSHLQSLTTLNLGGCSRARRSVP